MKVLLSALLICSAVACKKKEEPAKTESAPASTQAAAPAGATEPAAPAKEALDICAKISKEDIEASVGKLTGEPTPTPAQGSLLGQCDWMTDAGMASVSARPANEYDATASAYSKEAKEVAGIGEKAVATKYGYLIKRAGPYMLPVMVMTGKGELEPVKSEALAKLASAKL